MNDESSEISTLAPDQSEADLFLLLKKIQQQLNFLEKKIDMLISQSQVKPFRDKTSSGRPFQSRPFSKPPRSFDRPKSRSKEDHRNNARDRDSSQGHFYDRFKSPQKRGANPKKKPPFSHRKDRD